MVSVVLCTMREEFIYQAVLYFLQQTMVDKELIIILNHHSMELEFWRSTFQSCNEIHVFQMDEAKTLGECLNFAASKARYPIISKMDDDDYYSPDYLARSIQALRETQADIVGKAGIFVYFQRDRLLTLYHPELKKRYLNSPRFFLAGGTLTFKQAVWEKVPFKELNTGEDVQFQKDCLENRYILYSGEYSDYALIRYNKPHKHSWKVENEAFQKRCKAIAITDVFEEYVRKGGGS